MNSHCLTSGILISSELIWSISSALENRDCCSMITKHQLTNTKRIGGKLLNWLTFNSTWHVTWLKHCLTPGRNICSKRLRAISPHPQWSCEPSSELLARLGRRLKYPNPVVNRQDGPRVQNRDRENAIRSSKRLNRAKNCPQRPEISFNYSIFNLFLSSRSRPNLLTLSKVQLKGGSI